jgi:hypothetical protein
MRALALALLAAVAAASPAPAPPPPQREYVQAVEFPYYLYPRGLWDRELVWLDTIGIRTVAFSIPWNWHEPERGQVDFTGATSPRRDLAGLIRSLRRLGMHAWVRPVGNIKGWSNGGLPPWAARDRRAQRQWMLALERFLAPQLERHGGPIAFVEGAIPWADPDSGPPALPLPVTALSANDPSAMARSRAAIAGGRGSLLWEDVEDAIYPAGWEAPASPPFRKGAVSLNGDERPTVNALRRDAALLQHWAALIPPLSPAPAPVKLPGGVTALELLGRTPAAASALSIVNASAETFAGELRVHDRAKHIIPLPPVQIAPGDSLWLPVEVPLAGAGLCKDCSAFANGESIVYATAELQAVEFENGILAMEFAAPHAGEAVLQLSRKPSGPFLASGRPIDFDWDEKTLRAKLPIPAGKGPGSRVRIGLAIEPPETSAFFVDVRRLVIGRKNTISTSYSSEQVAQRSRLRLPENFTAKPTVKSPTEIDYEIDVPRDTLHGSWVNLAIEADGVQLGRARVQLFRAASVRFADAVKLHFGPEEELAVEPALLTIDPKANRNIDITVRNNSPQIQTFTIEARVDGWEFMPAKTEISIGAMMERTVSLRAFGKEGAANLSEGRVRISGGAEMELPLRIVAVPRGRTVAYSLDLDGDGAPEWVLESQGVRAVFSAGGGARLRELVWKSSGTNLVSELGLLLGIGAVEVRNLDDGFEFAAARWKNTVRLAGSALAIENSGPLLEGDILAPAGRDGVTLNVNRESDQRVVYSLAAEERR